MKVLAPRSRMAVRKSGRFLARRARLRLGRSRSLTRTSDWRRYRVKNSDGRENTSKVNFWVLAISAGEMPVRVRVGKI